MEINVINIGGIDGCSLTIQKGVTVLTGRNATNRTSLLQAINGVLGGSASTLKSDATDGEVALEVGSSTHTRRFERTDGGIKTGGTPYEANTDLVDPFVSLLENNPARQAVKRGDDLRDIIMRPVDTRAIEDRIRTLQSERDEISEELEAVREQSSRLPALEEERQVLESDLESIDERIESARNDATKFEANAEMAEEAEELVDRLDERRKEASKAEDDLELVNAELDSLRDQPSELRAKKEDLPEATEDDLDRLEDQLRSLRGQKRTLENTIANLRSIVEFNGSILEDSDSDHSVPAEAMADPVADLAPSSEQEITCWTCGNRAKRGEIADQLDSLRGVISEKQDELDDLTEQIDDVTDNKESIREVINTRERLSHEIENAAEKLEARQTRRDTLEDQIAELREAISELEQEVALTEDLRDNNLLETYEKISDLQYERGQKQEQLESVTTEIEDIESLSDKSRLRDQLDEIRTELRRERNRVTELESESVSQFNDHMEDVLALLDYRNISRVWIERKEASQDGHGGNSTFDLHVIRESESGAVYEDSVDNLSESEREVIGLVVGLAGYLVHDVHTTVPFMLLDSLEAVDSDRIADLIEYFSEYVPYLVVALLPEDAAAVTADYHEIPATALN
ncbi:archaea-specific SMC-related protein [Halorubrum sp. HHNYT27]|uniref:archaea-specific SMC-related protein n=1 Tax=Halorubrum sp. HHNYT27 TaxID=3402275 RepID=UPI003EBEEE58